MKTILFVCSQNRLGSPTAEQVFADHPGLEVCSAGTNHDAENPLAAELIHADVRAGWTVARLAAVAGMSRSAFSARFGVVVGCAPIEYLACWRMAIAKEALARGARSLDQVADQISPFCRRRSTVRSRPILS